MGAFRNLLQPKIDQKNTCSSTFFKKNSIACQAMPPMHVTGHVSFKGVSGHHLAPEDQASFGKKIRIRNVGNSC